MKAVQSITDLFKAQVTNPKNLQVWVVDGMLMTGQGEIDGFESEYTINIMMSDVSVAPEVVFMSLVTWLNLFDPCRSEKGLPYPSFATEKLDKGTFDIKIKLDFIEEFELKPDPEGDWQKDDQRYSLESTFTEIDYNALPFFEKAVNKGDLPC